MNSTSITESAVRQAAVEGGQVLMGYFHQTHKIWSKSSFEVVTEADIASEEAIVSEIKRLCPEHTIWTEEQGKMAGDDEHVWIVDPLDGTLNFALGHPYFSVSIAYEFRGIVEIALVYNPYTMDIYSACRGKGAFKNSVALHVSPVDELAAGFVCCDWGGSAVMQQQGLCYLSRLLPPTTLGVAVNFSPALDLCNLAEGNILVMTSNGTTTEDHAAGALIVREAGGITTNFGQTEWSHRTRGIIATNMPDIAGKVTQILKDCFD